MRAIPADVAALLRRHDLYLLLLQREVVADAVAGVTVTTEERRALRRDYLQRYQLADDKAFAKHLKQRGISEADLDWQMELPLRIQRHSMDTYGAKAEQRFLEHKNDLDQVVYSLLRLKNRFLAQELYMRIAETESDFAELASRHAEGPERTTRGVVGPVPLTQAHPVLAEHLRTSAPGTLLEPFQIEEWWLVVRLERYLPSKFDELIGQRMCTDQFEEWVQEEVARKMNELSVPTA